MDDVRKRLMNEQENLMKSIDRGRSAAEEITIEHTEDEGDRAIISHNKDLIYNLHEGAFARLRQIQEAIKALDRGQYGECRRCGEEINPKRLAAVPWAALCIECQEQLEAEGVSSQTVLPGIEEEDS